MNNVKWLLNHIGEGTDMSREYLLLVGLGVDDWLAKTTKFRADSKATS